MTKFAEDHDDYEPKHRREMGTTPGFGDIEVIWSQHLPKDTALLISKGVPGFRDDPYPPGSILRTDPWVANPRVKPEFEAERRKALEFLAGLLDDTYRGYRWDPQKGWRDPRLRDQERVWRDWTINERIAMQVFNPLYTAAKITGF